MKHFIAIPQHIIVSKGFKIDLVDAAIMDALIFLGTSPKSLRRDIGGKNFFWASYKALEALLPMVGPMSRKSWRQRFIKLEAAGLITVSSYENQRQAMTFVCFGPRYNEYVASADIEVQDPEQPTCYPKATPLLPKGNTPCYPKVTPLLPKGNTIESRDRKNNKEKEEKREALSYLFGEGYAEAHVKDFDLEALGINGEHALEASPALGLKTEAQAQVAGAHAWTMDDVRRELSKFGDVFVECFNESEEYWLSWMKYKRSEKRSGYRTAATFALLVRRISTACNFNASVIRECIEASQANGWSGLFPPKNKEALCSEPYDPLSKPSGDVRPSTLSNELRAFYQKHPEFWEEIVSGLRARGFLYDKRAGESIVNDFCISIVSKGYFDASFAQLHASLMQRILNDASRFPKLTKTTDSQMPSNVDINPLKFSRP